VATTVMAIIVDKIIMIGPINTEQPIEVGTYIKKAHTKFNSINWTPRFSFGRVGNER
jgi:hypothetical protein